LIGGWIGPRAGLEVVANKKNPFLSFRELNLGRLDCILVPVLTELQRTKTKFDQIWV